MKTAKNQVDAALSQMMSKSNKSKEPAAKSVRSGLIKLVQLFTRRSFRLKLAAESGGGTSSVVLKEEALSVLWKSVLSVAMVAIKSLWSKKPEIGEYQQFSNLLSIYSPSDESDDSDLRPRLSLETIGKVRDFVLDLFNQEKIVEAAESELLLILTTICSRRDYVGVFRLGDFDDVMEILELRLDVQTAEEYGVPFKVVEASAGLFEALINTCTTIGISMHDHFAECMFWVAQRCEAYVAGTANASRDMPQKTMILLLRAVASLMRFEPDQAIGPLGKYGKKMLGVARRIYACTDGANKEAVVGYLTAHLIVCQVAGTFQGLPSGDLGDVGKGSLNMKMLQSLLELVANEKEIIKIMAEEVKFSKNDKSFWKPLSTRQQRHLGLCARLVACVQRLYLVDENWKAIDDPVEHILGSIEFDDNPKSQMSDCSTEPTIVLPFSKVIGSPFMEAILSPLWNAIGQVSQQTPQSTSFSQSSGIGSSNVGTSSDDNILSTFPILSFLKEQKSFKDVTSIVPYLQLLCACCEAFPFGECWSSCTSDNWTRFRPEDNLCDDACQIKTSSPNDLAVVVTVAGRVLESAGKPGECGHVQVWVLRSLLQLAEVSVCLASVSKKSLDILSLAWQSIWRILLLPSLRFVSFTKTATPNSCGELVLILLNKIIYYGCADLTGKRKNFLINEVHTIWNLPIFADSFSVRSPVIFDLIRSVLCQFGIREEIPANIDSALLSSLSPTAMLKLQNCFGERFKENNRVRLLCFSLRRLSVEIANASEKKLEDPLISSLMACCSSIVFGKNVFSKTSKSEVDKWLSLLSSEHYSVTDLKSNRSELLHTDATKLSVHEGIRWKQSMKVLDTVQESIFSSKQTLKSWAAEKDNMNKGFVSQRQIEKLQEFSVECLSMMVSHQTCEALIPNESEASPINDQNHALNPLIGKMCMVKCLLALTLGEKETIFLHSDLAKNVIEKAAGVIDDFVEALAISADLIIDGQMLSSMEALIFEVLHLMPRKLANELLKVPMLALGNVCRDLLDGYNRSYVQAHSKGPSSGTNRMQADLSDSEDDQEDPNESAPIPRSNGRLSIASTPSKRQRTRLTSVSIDSLNAASSVASILIMLEPTTPTCTFVYQQLATFESIQSSFSDRQKSFVDLESAKLALLTFCSNIDMLVKAGSADGCLLSLCLSIIAELREGVHGGNDHFAAGYQELTLMLEKCVIADLSIENKNMLTEMLLMSDARRERKWLVMRPTLSVQRLVAAIAAYENCGRCFRDSFQRNFASEFVLEPLNNESTQVRLKSAHALGVALRYLENQKFIYENVYQALGVGKSHHEGAPILHTLCEAQKGRDGSSCWRMLSASVRYCLLRLWGVIAGCTSDRSVFQERMFDCIHFAGSNMLYEPVTQIAVQKMSVLRGYESAEALIRDETEYILQRWIALKKVPGSVPINFSSGAVLSVVIRWGLTCVDKWGVLELQREKIASLMEQATAEFVFASVAIALPVCLSQFSALELKDFIESKPSMESNELVSYLRALNEISHDSDKVPQILDFMSSHVSNILAYGILQAARGASVGCAKSNELIELAFDLASSINDYQSRRDLLLGAVRQLVLIQGREQTDSLDSTFLLRLDNLSPCGWPELVTVVRYGSVELIAICRYWLDRAQVDANKLSHWKMMQTVIRIILYDEKATTVVQNLALRSILGLLRSNRFRCCHLTILAFIKADLGSRIHQLVFNNSVDKILAFQLVGTLLQVHETCQENMVNSLRHRWQSDSKLETSSFRRFAERIDPANGRDLKDVNLAISRLIQSDPDYCLPILSPFDKDLASNTYDHLKDILEEWSVSGDKNVKNAGAEFASFVRKSGHFETLANLNKKYFAQDLIKICVNSSREMSAYEELAVASSRFGFLKKSVRLLGVDTRHAADPTELLSLDARLLLDQIMCLNRALTRCGATISAQLISENCHLARDLFDTVSSESNPPKLRIEASKCLGHIGPSLLSKLDDFIDDETDWLKKIGGRCGELMEFFVSQVLADLLEHMKSEEPVSSLSCLEACREIASTQEGTEAIRKMTAGDDQEFMKTLVRASLKKRPALLTPSTRFVATAIKVVSPCEGSKDDCSNWCWAEKLWGITGISFDGWIKRLVSSIIICCYGKKSSKDAIRGSSLSFRACARISAISSSIATFLLPRILIDILDSDVTLLDEEGRICTTVRESWIGDPCSLATQKVSDAFTFLAQSLEKCSDNECKSKASNVLSSTLDLMRRISQQRFLAATFKPSAYKPKPDGKSKPRLFGSTLNFSPDAVIQAFIASNKVASAVYYAETALFESGLDASTWNDLNLNAKNGSNKTPQNSWMAVLEGCMFKLEEVDAASAYSLRMASMKLLRGGFRLADHILSQSTPAEKLQLLSVKQSTTDQNLLQTAQCLCDLGSISTLTSFTNDVFRQHELSESTRSALKESWFQAKMTAMQWTDIPELSNLEPNTGGNEQGFFESLSGAFSSIKHGDKALFKDHLATCRFQLLSQCSQRDGRESIMTSLLPMIERFEILNDLDVLGKDGSSVQAMLRRWEKEASEQSAAAPSVRYVQGEFKLATRENIINILKDVGVEVPHFDIDSYLIKHQWLSASIGRDQGHLEFAERCLQRSEISISCSDTSNHLWLLKIRLEEAKLLENRGYFKLAIQTTKLVTHAIDELEQDVATNNEWTELRADSLLACGIWTRRHRVESAKHAQENYLMPAVAACRELWQKRESKIAGRRLGASCVALAQNAAALFDNVNQHITSKEWKAKGIFLENQRKLYQQLLWDAEQMVEGSESKEDIGCRHRVRKVISRLEEEMTKEEDDLGPYANLALEAFGEALCICDNSSRENWTQHVFQMVSIWFSSHQRVEGVNEVVRDLISRIPSFRFVPLAYQLFSRISSKQGEEFEPFQVVLQQLVSIMCGEHPYHCLLQLFALRNGGNGSSMESDSDPKVRAANTVMATLRSVADDNQLELYNAYEAITEAYHLLAMAKPTKAQIETKMQIPISAVVKASGGKQLHRAVGRNRRCVPCVLTRPPLLLENHDYGDYKTDPPGTELIASFDTTFDVTPSGIHHPKIVRCIGSNKTVFKQLVKGEDDIRQDAVMEQVFTYTNELMRLRTTSRPSTSSREPKGTSRSVGKTLKLVTYNIVPLSPLSGVLEWVNNTQPLNDYLADKGTGRFAQIGAHSRYYEGEWNSIACARLLKKATTPDMQRRTFDLICQNFSPVFRYFFVEMFGHDLQKWHTAKMAYTRSCAVSSIVGHVLGIGDRHASNILVHQKTGEVVHIDFGIVFEQGRNLPIPETVPFRLTRDIVDGMGPLGTEGTFTAAAEETTRILRNNSNALLTILSAVVNDPLYEWKKSAGKARVRQEQEQAENENVDGAGDETRTTNPDVEDPEDNLAAMHAIARIKEKLQGYEEGTSSEQLSIDGQVQLLINSARDPDNLCTIFCGWQPFM